MNFERFIAGRLSNQKSARFSAIIIRLAMLSVAISTIVIIVTSSVITGFKEEVANKVFNFWGHIHITDGRVGRQLELSPITKDPALIDSIARIEQAVFYYPEVNVPRDQWSLVSSQKGVANVSTYTMSYGVLSTNKGYEGVVFRGLESDYHWETLKEYLKAGELIDYREDRPSRDLLISEQIAQRLQLEVGDAIIASFIMENDKQYKRRLKVKGIYRTGLEEYDKRYVIVDADFLKQILGWETNQVSGLEVYVDQLDDLDILSHYIYFQYLPGNLYSESIRQKYGEIFNWLDLQDINEKVLLVLMLLVAVINMITALIIFVMERTPMIGTLKALGATNWSIRKIFLYNSAQIILKGLFWGNVIGLGICFLQQVTGIMKLSEEDYYLDTVPIQFNWDQIIMLNMISIVTILIFLILPSLIISHIEPTKAMKIK